MSKAIYSLISTTVIRSAANILVKERNNEESHKNRKASSEIKKWREEIERKIDFKRANRIHRNSYTSTHTHTRGQAHTATKCVSFAFRDSMNLSIHAHIRTKAKVKDASCKFK